MPLASELITQALAPGIALSAVMLYVSGLQARFSYVASRTRALNDEARGLRAAGDGAETSRLASIRAQVDVLIRRIGMVRQTILICYGALFCFILSILLRLVQGLLPGASPDVLPAVCFGLGFLALGAATLYSSAEMLLSVRTLREDVRTSFGEDAA